VTARGFLQALAASPDRAVDAPVMIVCAHPDDETIALGAQMRRLTRLEIVTVTDGAPTDMRDAHVHGFATRDAYAQARRRELAAAIGLAGVPEGALRMLGCRDQEAAHRLVGLCEALAALFEARAPEIVVTHALEGGHPDHDATAFAARAARRLAVRRGARAPELAEALFYRLEGDGVAAQTFAPGSGAPETTLRLDEAARALKRRMIAAHAAQAAVLGAFDVDAERLRPAEPVDPSTQPDAGARLYDSRPWGLSGEGWRERVDAARRALDLPERI
jgi:LmbE family N-acetylglucosaminyl deacetylase